MTVSAEQRIYGLLLGIALLLLAFTQTARVNALRALALQSGAPVTTVSAASFAPIVAPDAIAAAFGTRLATATQAATIQPLPTSLAGTTIKVNGVLAQLFFVSPTQVNYVIPTGTASGAASVIVTSGDGTVSMGTAQVSTVAPAVFSANASGAGVPAAVLIRAKTDGTQPFESVAQLDPTTNLFVPKPISFGASGERLFLIIYLCGIRNAPDADGNPSNGVAESIRVMLGGTPITPLFAGAAPGFAGLDQINVELARDLNGRVSAQIEFTSITSNVTEIEVAAPGRAATTLALSSSAATPVYGQAVTFTAQVNAVGGTPAGSVIFRDGAATLGSSNLSAGRATITASTLAVGSHQISAHYSGDNSFSGNWTKLANGQTVNKASSALAIVSSANPSIAGQAVTFIARVSAVAPGSGAPAGGVIFTDNGTMIGAQMLDAAGQATITLPLNSAGPHTIAASYDGDANFAASAGTLSGGQVVNKVATAITVSSSANPSSVGQTVTFVATVTGSTTGAGILGGSVQFKDNEANLGAQVPLTGASASFSTTALTAGTHTIKAEYSGSANYLSSVSSGLSQTVTGNSTTPIIGSVSPTNTYAGQELVISGAGFAANLQDNIVRVVDSESESSDAQVLSASPNQLRVLAPFGAGSGRVVVRTQLGEAASTQSLNMRTSVSGFIQDGNRSPIRGLTVRVRGTNISTQTNADGAFILVDTPPSNSAEIEVNGTTAPGGLPYPSPRFKMRVRANRDNPFGSYIELQPASGPSITIGSGRLVSDNQLAATAAWPAIPSEPQGTIQNGQVILDVPNNATVLFPDGRTSGTLTLTLLNTGRTPTRLPDGHFSSVIAQITPFGATIMPGAKITFPNSEAYLANSQVKLFRFDQRQGISTAGEFIEAGTATVSADGQRIESTPNAVIETSYYFVSGIRPTVTLTGPVVENDFNRTPVRNAKVNARGQGEIFTDGSGRFLIRNVPVTPGSGFVPGAEYQVRNGEAIAGDDRIGVEGDYLRPSARVDRSQRENVAPSPAGGSVSVPPLILSPLTSNRPPSILAPASLTINSGTTVDIDVFVSDPDPGQIVQLTVTGPSFAALVKVANDAYKLRLSPGANDGGNYTLTLTANDGQGGTAAHTIALRANGNGVLAIPQVVIVNKNTPKAITLTGSDPANRPLQFILVSQPLRGTLSGTPPQVTYTPARDYVGPDSFMFKINNGQAESDPATVTIDVRATATNNPPSLTVPSLQSVNGGELLSFIVTASDPDPEQTLEFTRPTLPTGADVVKVNPVSVRFTWQPTYRQAGTYSVNFTVMDNGTPTLSETKTVAITVDAKWAKTSGPDGGAISSLLNFEGAIYAGTIGGIYRSTDNGRSWFSVNEGLSGAGLYVLTLASAGTNIYAGTLGGVYRSSDGGRNWTAARNGLSGNGVFVNALLLTGTNLYAGTLGGIYRSSDGGQNWIAISNGLSGAGLRVYALLSVGTTLYAGTQGGVYRSSDGAPGWAAVNSGLSGAGLNINILLSVGTNLYAGTNNGIYRSSNGGENWAAFNNGLPAGVPVASLLSLNSLSGTSLSIFAGTRGTGIYRSIDGGQSWANISEGITGSGFNINALLHAGGTSVYAGTPQGIYQFVLGVTWGLSTAGMASTNVRSLLATSSYLFAGTYGNGIYRSSDGGQSWSAINRGLPNVASYSAYETNSLLSVGSDLYAGTNGYGVYRSGDDGANWVVAGSGLSGNGGYVHALLSAGADLYVGTDNGVYRSTNSGQNWSPVNNGLTGFGLYVYALLSMRANLYAGTDNGIYRSSNGGQSWAPANSGLSGRALNINALLSLDTSLYAATQGGGVYRSSDGGQSWAAINNGLSGDNLFVYALLSVGTNLYVGTERGFYRLSNDEQTWTWASSALNTIPIQALAARDTKIFAGTFGNGTWLLADASQSWTETNVNLTNKFASAITVNGTGILVGTLGSGVFRSSNQGQSWNTVNNGLPPSASVSTIATSENLIFAGTLGDGIYRSANNAASWVAVNNGFANPPDFSIKHILVNGTKLFAATNGGGVFRSTDQGNNWVRVNNNLNNLTVLSLAALGDSIFAGVAGGGVYRSDDNGNSWVRVSNGLTGNGLYVRALATYATASGIDLYAGTEGGGIYVSKDRGTIWTAVNNRLSATSFVNALMVRGGKIYAGTVSGVFLTEDGGATWKQVNAGLLNIYVNSLAFSGNNLFAGTLGGGFFASQIPSDDCPQPFYVDGVQNTTSTTWLDTGINVTSGQPLRVTARGIACIAPLSCWNADGDPNGGLYNGSNYGSLVGRIGTGPQFTVGASYQRPVPATGRLYLALNDSFIPDNYGGYDVCVNVTQGTTNCTYTITPTSQSFAVSGGTGSVNVATQPNCAWTAASNASWITITSGAGGNGNGAVSFTVGANTGIARMGTMTIAGQIFTVTQAASSCGYSIAPTSQSFSASGGGGNVNVTTASSCAWTATSNASWITITAGASGSGNGTVSFFVAANANSSQRAGTLTIAGQTFTVTQTGGSGERMVARIYNIDDRASVYVNGQLMLQRDFGQSASLDITDQLATGVNNIRFVLESFGGGYTYGFILEQNGQVIFREECGTSGVIGCNDNESKPAGIIYDKTVSIVVNPSAIKASVYNIDDRASVYLNGTLVGQANYRETKEFDLTNALRAGRNEVRLALENFSEGYTYGFRIFQGTQLIFNEECGVIGTSGCNNNDERVGIVFDKTVLIFVIATQ